ncbi:MAG TPA: heat-inducible transcriptional repressor HrcA [Anaerolineales bacterium]|jgi:heat-inducible transcriptional repressor
MTELNALSERQETVLALIIHEFVEATAPIGSERLVDTYRLEVSPATVRNDMALLTEAGLLRQPHTSAGRIPTEEGYRYFVRRLLGDIELAPEDKRLIQHQFHQARAEVDEWLRLAAAILARQSRAASLVTAPHPDQAHLKHVELIETTSNQVLLVIVWEGGDVRQQLLTMAEPYGQETLSATANQITHLCQGLTADEVRQKGEGLQGLAAEVVRLIAETMARSDAASAGDIYRDGLANVLMQPEFSDTESLGNALRLLEERSYLEHVLAEALSPSASGVQVVIGGEGTWEELRDLSIILARYGAPGQATGALAVLGPTRMAYGRSISAVRYVAGLMTNMVQDAFAGQSGSSQPTQISQRKET